MRAGVKRRIADQISGGLADESELSEFDPQQLEIGQSIEMEHTEEPEIATEIASDHLEEIPDYYTRLEEMEEEYKKTKAVGTAKMRKEAQKRIAAFTTTCLDCVGKHLGQAGALLGESKKGYPEHFWLAVGHIAEAEDELLKRHPKLARQIAEDRRKMMENREQIIDIPKYLKLFEELTKDKTIPQTDRLSRISVVIKTMT